MDVDRALERYLRHHRTEGSTQKTLAWHRLSIGQFAQFLKDQGHSGDVEDLAADDLRGWIEQLQDKGLSQSSVATKVRSVKALGKWLVAEEYAPRDPFARVKRPREDEQPVTILSPDEVGRLLACCDRKRAEGARDFALLLLLYSTGIRASELLGLQVPDINWDQSMVTVRRGKGGKPRVVPLGRMVERAVTKYLNHPKRRDQGQGAVLLTAGGAPLHQDGLTAIMRRRGRDAGVRCHPHQFRHTCGVQYLRSGGRVEVLQALFGHQRLEMTLRYARIAAPDVVADHDIADPARSIKVRV